MAANPRSMLMPWSPSPIAWSSAVSAVGLVVDPLRAEAEPAFERVEHRVITSAERSEIGV